MNRRLVEAIYGIISNLFWNEILLTLARMRATFWTQYSDIMNQKSTWKRH